MIPFVEPSSEPAFQLLVSCPRNTWHIVAFNMARRQGETKANIPMDLQLRSNAGAGPFSTQPAGPGDFWRSPALLARARSQRILPLRSRLGDRQNALRQYVMYFWDRTLDEGRNVPHPGKITLLQLFRSFWRFQLRSKVFQLPSEISSCPGAIQCSNFGNQLFVRDRLPPNRLFQQDVEVIAHDRVRHDCDVMEYGKPPHQLDEFEDVDATGVLNLEDQLTIHDSAHRVIISPTVFT
ncbi:unnamed protein product [uncultured bacterium]|nr:unnamed protein product [uncultured bacterium]